MASSLEQGLWSLVSDETGLRVHLAEPVRRSALHLVSHAAERSYWSDAVASVLSGAHEGVSSADLAKASALDYLNVITESDPASWRRLCDGLAFDVNLLPEFRSWFLTLVHSGLRWTSEDELWELWQEQPGMRTTQGRDAFAAVLNLHTVTVKEAIAWGVQAPLLRCGELGLLAWPFVFHVLPPRPELSQPSRASPWGAVEHHGWHHACVGRGLAGWPSTSSLSHSVGGA